MCEGPRVVHVKWPARRGRVYVGRPSEWGNPFVIGRDGDRETCVAKHRRWIFSQKHLLARLHELRGRDLACWCAPRPCHADILLQLANQDSTMLVVKIVREIMPSGLLVATSPDARGLLATGNTETELDGAIVKAIEDLYRATGETVAVTQLEPELFSISTANDISDKSHVTRKSEF